MHASLLSRSVQFAHPALPRQGMQLFSLIFLTLSACVSSPPANLNRMLPDGYYVFDCPIVYEKGMVRLQQDQDTVRVTLLEKFDGSFSFMVRPDHTVVITDADMGLPGLNRSFRGKGTLSRPGHAEGRAVSWLKTSGPISRNHREGPWTLLPASAKEIENFEREQRELEERKARAREAGLDI